MGPTLSANASASRPRTWAGRLLAAVAAAGVVLWSAAYIGAQLGQLSAAPGGGGGASIAAAGPTGTPTGAPGSAGSGESPAPGASGAAATPSPAPTLPPPSDQPMPVGPVEFGMSGHLMWHDVPAAIHELDMLRADGLSVIRFDVSWRNMEPRPGHYAYLSKLDAIVNASVARHITPIVTIIETPAWANGGRDAWVPPDDPGQYGAFAAMLAKRYAGRVDDWEIWNEPDIPLFWHPAPDVHAYARLLKAASAAIRAANPRATIVGGSVTFGNVGYLKALYADGVQGTFDVLSVHPYTLTHAPGDMSDRYHSLSAILDDMRSVMLANGDGATPVWVTELGWAVVGLNSVSPPQRVAYLAQSVRIILERPWVKLLAVYTIDTSDSARFGLSTQGVRSPAWLSYVAAVHRAQAAP